MDTIAKLQNILQRKCAIAVVGLSGNWYRPSFFAAKYMQQHGYRVIPVNPNYEEILGEKCYADLAAIPKEAGVEIVDVFQRAERTPAIAEAAVAIGAKVLWLQLGVVSEEARRIAEAGGVEVVMDRCVKIEHARLFGGLNFAGVNTKVISSRRFKVIAN